MPKTVQTLPRSGILVFNSLRPSPLESSLPPLTHRGFVATLFYCISAEIQLTSNLAAVVFEQLMEYLNCKSKWQ